MYPSQLPLVQVVGVTDGAYSMSVVPGTTDGDGGGDIGPVEEVDEGGGGGGRPEQDLAVKRSRAKGRFDSLAKNLSLQMLNRYGIDSKTTSIIFYCKPITGRRSVTASCLPKYYYDNTG